MIQNIVVGDASVLTNTAPRTLRFVYNRRQFAILVVSHRNAPRGDIHTKAKPAHFPGSQILTAKYLRSGPETVVKTLKPPVFYPL